jgi:two-component system sensor histidine kinase KdpD
MADPSPNPLSRLQRSSWRPYLATIAVVAVCGLASWAAHERGLSNANVVMIFLAGVALVAARFGHGPAIASAILSVLVFDYFFVEPIYSFAPSDTQYFVDLAVMLGIAILVSELTARLQSQLRASRDEQRRTAQLYRLTRQLGASVGIDELISNAGEELSEMFAADVALYLRDPSGDLGLKFGKDSPLSADAQTLAAAEEIVKQQQAGDESKSSFSGSARLVVLQSTQQLFGVISVRPYDAQRFQQPEECKMLDTCASLIALSLERDRLLTKAREAELQVQAEQLRNSLLSSVSHDMRTPLALIAVTASGLLDESIDQRGTTKQEMLQTVVDESNRLARQVENLLEMARLNSGDIALHKQWHVLEELVGVSLARLRAELNHHAVHIDIPGDLPLVYVADTLIEQMFVNLLENAVRYTPPGSGIEIEARQSGTMVEVRVVDNGPGFPPGSEAKLFDAFFRGKSTVADGQRGIGLGLAICQGIVRLHDGEIRAANRAGGGAEFTISLPCAAGSPDITEDEMVWAAE